MTDFVDLLRAQVGKTLRSSKFDPKTGIMTLEFDDSALSTKLSVYAKNNALVGMTTVPVKKAKDKKLKAKEEALGDLSTPKTKGPTQPPRKRGKKIDL